MKQVYRILIAGAATIAATSINTAQAQDFPPDTAKPGECYAKVLIPANYQTTSERIMVHAGGTAFRKTPAVYSDVKKQVLIQEESYILEPVPPVYETITEQVLIQPEQVVKTVVPATYRTETKQIMVSPSRIEWKQGRGPFEKIDEATGDILCRVEVPAIYETVEQEVISTPSASSEETIPAKYMTIERRRMKTEPSTTRKLIPAEYKTITVKELVTPEGFAAI